MKVKLLVSRAGTDFVQNVGDVIEVGNAEAKRMIESAQCEPVSSKRSEKATAEKGSTRAT